MVEEKRTPDQELLKLEYQECSTHSRFTVGNRFTYFVSFTTFFFILIGTYNYVWVTEAIVFGPLKPTLLLLISGFGLIAVAVAWMIEHRCVHIYRTCDNRAAVIEGLMDIGGVSGGIWQILTDPGRRRRFLGIPIGHATAILLFYGTVLTIWLSLLLFSSYLFLFTG